MVSQAWHENILVSSPGPTPRSAFLFWFNSQQTNRRRGLYLVAGLGLGALLWWLQRREAGS